MRRFIVILLPAVLVAFALSVHPVAAQEHDLLERGKQAFRDDRFAEAAEIFERVTRQDPDNAEAHYLLARVYFETPLRDERKARRALERALELEPDNLQFLVARLQQLRTESWNFFAERIKEARRVELARQILKLDPDNPFAHEELGSAYIRDFWRYRNAIMLPTLKFRQQGFRPERAEAPPVNVEALGGIFADQEGIESPDELFADIDEGPEPLSDPSAVFHNDRFDVDALREQGVPVQELSARAQRAYERAIGHLEKALEVDPRRRSVYELMMQLYALKGEYAEALEMLQQMYRFFPDDATLWTYLGITHYKLGNMEAADRSFTTAFRYMTEEERQAYQSLELLLPQEELAAYWEDPVAYAARFWTSKDPRYLTTYNERKLEHYARLSYADLLYGAKDLDLRGWETERGRILVRYGEPLEDVVIVPKEGQFYARELLNGAVFASASEDQRADMPLMGLSTAASDAFEAQVTSAEAMFDELNTYNIWEYGSFRFIFEDPFRNGEYRMYSPPAADLSQTSNAWAHDYVIKTQEILGEHPEEYEYEAPGRQIELPYLVTAFKGEEGKTDLYVHYGLPINEYDPDQEMIEITANTGTFLISQQRDLLVERRRTIYGLPTSQILEFEEQYLWTDSQVMEAPPGEHEVSLEFETASGATVAVQRRGVTVPDYSGDRLGLSDLMLAYRIEDAIDGEPQGANEIVRNGLSILPAPWSVFSHEQPIYLYFEVYNLEAGPDGRTDYEVDVVLVPKEEAKGIRKLWQGLFGRERGVAVSFPGSGTRTDEGHYQILDATDQEPGLYTLILCVHDNNSGETVEREQDLFLE